MKNILENVVYYDVTRFVAMSRGMRWVLVGLSTPCFKFEIIMYYDNIFSLLKSIEVLSTFTA